MVEAPVNSMLVDVAAPSVVEVVFELAFIDKIVDFTPEPLQLSCAVHLPEAASQVVVSHSKVVVNRVLRVPDDVFSVENPQFLPLFEAGLKDFFIVQGVYDTVIFRICLELFKQDNWEVGSLRCLGHRDLHLWHVGLSGRRRNLGSGFVGLVALGGGLLQGTGRTCRILRDYGSWFVRGFGGRHGRHLFVFKCRLFLLG